jgi:Mg-chelatase subunit ChlD
MKPPESIHPEDDLEVRILALLLGELSETDAAELQARIDANAELKAMRDRLADTLGLVREAATQPMEGSASQADPLKLSDDRRTRLLERFKTVPMGGSARGSEWKRYAPLGLAAALVGLISVAVFRFGRMGAAGGEEFAFQLRGTSDPGLQSAEAKHYSRNGRAASSIEGLGYLIVTNSARLSAGRPAGPVADDFAADARRSGLGAPTPSLPASPPTSTRMPTSLSIQLGLADREEASASEAAQKLAEFGRTATAGERSGDTLSTAATADPSKSGRLGGAGAQFGDDWASEGHVANGRAAGSERSRDSVDKNTTIHGSATADGALESGAFDFYAKNQALDSLQPVIPPAGVPQTVLGSVRGNFSDIHDPQNLGLLEKAEPSANLPAESDSATPVVGDLPVLGRLFKAELSTETAGNPPPVASGRPRSEVAVNRFGLEPALSPLATSEASLSAGSAGFGGRGGAASPRPLPGVAADVRVAGRRNGVQDQIQVELKTRLDAGVRPDLSELAGNPESAPALIPSQQPGHRQNLSYGFGSGKISNGVRNEELARGESESPAQTGGRLPSQEVSRTKDSAAAGLSDESRRLLGEKPLQEAKFGEVAEGAKKSSPQRQASEQLDQTRRIVSEFKRPVEQEKNEPTLPPAGPVTIDDLASPDSAENKGFFAKVGEALSGQKDVVATLSVNKDEAAKITNKAAEVYRDGLLQSKGGIKAKDVAVLEKQLAEREVKLAQLAEALVELPALQQKAPDDLAATKSKAAAPIPQPEVLAADNAFSTFSLNVSDVSFKLATASLEQGKMPEPASIRSEEFINAFDYRDPAPAAGAPLAFAWDRARSPFEHNRDLLRLSVETAAAGRSAGQPLNLVVLLDNSGSMERADRVRIRREALRVLATQLRPQDRLSVVTFARTAHLRADGVSGDQALAVFDLLDGVTPEGGTNLEEAMGLAYQTAQRHLLANGVNRVVMLTDGAANLGNVDPESLKKTVESNRRQGVALDCFGVGWEGLNDDLLETLSRNGDGRYGFLNSPEEAASGFAQQLAGALRVAASDVKVQVEFNPKRVTAYRQIGYAKHQLTKEQFRDNSVDAAEIGAAEAGNALYTMEVNPQGEGPLATVRVRYRVPGTQDYREHAWEVPFNGAAPALEQAAPAMRLAATAAEFAEWLSDSAFAGEVSPDALRKILVGVPEFYGANSRAKALEEAIATATRLGGK